MENQEEAKRSWYNVYYLSHCMTDVHSNIMDWLIRCYERHGQKMAYIVQAGYDKGIREIKAHFSKGTQPEQPRLPALIYNGLNGDMVADQKFLNLYRSEIGIDLYSAYLGCTEYEDRYFGYSIPRLRITGNGEYIILCESQYSYTDMFLQTLMIFHGGVNRRIREAMVKTECVIPENIITQAYPDGTWFDSGVTRHFIKSMNGDFFVLPLMLGPQIWLTGISNASTIYGENDVSEYKLQVTFEYDVDLPAMMVCRSDMQPMALGLSLETQDSELIYDHIFTPSNQTLEDISKEWFERAMSTYYFAKMDKDDYFKLIYSYDDLARFVNEPEDYVQVLALEYKFPKDCRPGETPYIIDMSSIPYEIDDYSEIVVGMRSDTEGYGILKGGDAYTVDFNETRKCLIPSIDIDAGTIWDIVIYKKSEDGGKPKCKCSTSKKKKSKTENYCNSDIPIPNRKGCSS